MGDTLWKRVARYEVDLILTPLRVIAFIVFLPFILLVFGGAILTGNSGWLKEREEWPHDSNT